MTDNENIGYLRIRASSGSEAFPVDGAVVLVSRENPDGGDTGVIYSLRTDPSGLTAEIPLETKARSLSESPGNVKPYTTYSVLVDADGYYPVNISGVSVFEGIRATLPVNLVPVDYAGGSSRQIDINRDGEGGL